MTDPISITLPGGEATVVDDQLDAKRRDRDALAERGGFCVVSTVRAEHLERAPVGERDDEVRGRR